MKRIRLAGVALVAALALSAVVSAAASAAPVFLTKTVVAEGAKIPISATLGAAFLEGSVSKSKISCTAGTGVGEVTGPIKTEGNVVTFTGCETSGTPCNSSGQASGTIITFTLAGKLGGLSATLPGVRLFSQAEGRGGKLAEFSCAGGAVKVVVTGSVIGSLSGAAGTSAETGKILTSGKFTFAEAGGIQKYTSFTEGPEKGEKEQLSASINSGTPELSGQSVIATLKTVPSTWGLGVTK